MGYGYGQSCLHPLQANDLHFELHRNRIIDAPVRPGWQDWRNIPISNNVGGVNSRSKDSFTPLLAAAETGDAVGAQKLLKAGADPTFKNTYGNTAESESCDRGEHGHFLVCQLVREALLKK